MLRWNETRFPCALGQGGVHREKIEGDGATPLGMFALCRVLYRPDRLAPPRTALPLAPLSPRDGWCNDATHPLYNHQVRQPVQASCELLWRTDSLYDVIVVLGHNDNPVVPGAGSAVFLHISGEAYLWRGSKADEWWRGTAQRRFAGYSHRGASVRAAVH